MNFPPHLTQTIASPLVATRNVSLRFMATVSDWQRRYQQVALQGTCKHMASARRHLPAAHALKMEAAGDWSRRRGLVGSRLDGSRPRCRVCHTAAARWCERADREVRWSHGRAGGLQLVITGSCVARVAGELGDSRSVRQAAGFDARRRDVAYATQRTLSRLTRARSFSTPCGGRSS